MVDLFSMSKYLLIVYTIIISTFIWSLDKKLLNTAKISKNSSESLYKKAERLFYEKKFTAAENSLKNLLVNINEVPTPIQSKSYSLLGDIYFFQKKYTNAISYYQNALEFSEDTSVENFRLGQIYMLTEDYTKAKSYFNLAYSTNSNLKICLFQFGYITLVADRDKQETIRYWKQFIKEAPNDPQYENVKKAIALLEDPNFIIPPQGSDISLQEALLLGGSVSVNNSETEDVTSGDEKSKENNKGKELLEDENL